MSSKSSSHLLAVTIVSVLLLICSGVSLQAQGGGAEHPPSTAGKSTGKRASTKSKDSASSSRARRAAEEKARLAREEKERIQREADARVASERAERERAQREAAEARAAREAAEAKRKELEALLPNAKIESVWTEPNVTQDNKLGMRIHAKFDINNLKDTECATAAYFYLPNGEKLKDLNGSYTTADGQVSVWEEFKPPYVNAAYKDFSLFIPYSELHLSAGDSRLKYYFYLGRKGGDRLAASDWVELTVTASQLQEAQRIDSLPNGKIQSVSVEYNVTENDKAGMRIHVKFQVNNLLKVPCVVAAYFYYQTGGKLTLNKSNGRYTTPEENQVAVGEDFTPPYVNSLYEDFRLFIPYKEFYVGEGTFNLKFQVSLYPKGGNFLATSGDQNFTMTNPK